MADTPFPVHLPLSEAQRAFVAAAEQCGATEPGRAVPLTELPRLGGRELEALVEAGLVREAANWRYYVFRGSGRDGESFAATEAPRPGSWSRSRLLRVFLFWILAILIPLLFLRLFARP